MTEDGEGQGWLFDAAPGAVEAALRASGHGAVIGVDEAGRGPLAGPVTVSAVWLPLGEEVLPPGVDDSKRLSEAVREALAPALALAVRHVVVHVSVDEIEQRNIRGATLWGMGQAVEALVGEVLHEGVPPLVLVDGRDRIPGWAHAQVALVKGDQRSSAIAAASILAKTARDGWMRAAAERYPGYGFAEHKGYGTRSHRQALAALGPCPIHRRGFRWSPPS